MNPIGATENPMTYQELELPSVLQTKLAELAAEVARLGTENKVLKHLLDEANQRLVHESRLNRDLMDEADRRLEGNEDEVVEWDEKSKQIFADRRWANQQQRQGKLGAYADEHVGIFEQKVVGHNESLTQLRIDVEREHGIGPDRLVTTYVFGPKGIGTRPVWRGFNW